MPSAPVFCCRFLTQPLLVIQHGESPGKCHARGSPIRPPMISQIKKDFSLWTSQRCSFLLMSPRIMCFILERLQYFHDLFYECKKSGPENCVILDFSELLAMPYVSMLNCRVRYCPVGDRKLSKFFQGTPSSHPQRTPHSIFSFHRIPVTGLMAPTVIL